jgi:hypothetical protein
MTDGDRPGGTPISISDVSGTSLLRLARVSRDAARKKLRGLAEEEQARACLELRPEVRTEFLMLLDHPEHVVPLLSDAEVCVTIRGSGMSDGAWLLELATREQKQACFDLDCWQGPRLDLERTTEWLDALLEAGPETLARAVEETDRELWVLLLRSLARVEVIGKEETPPDGSITADGVVHFVPHEGSDPARVEQLAKTLAGRSPGEYWGLVYGSLFESPSELEEYALRWRSGRLADLGFPEREQALRAYARLRPEQAPVLDVSTPGAALVPTRTLPRQLQGSLVGESLRKLGPDRAGELLGYVLAVANALAVADDLVLSDPEAVPLALEKAVRGIDVGLRELARLRGRPAEEVLDSTLPLDLFRIGATLDASLRKQWADPDDEADAGEEEGGSAE